MPWISIAPICLAAYARTKSINWQGNLRVLNKVKHATLIMLTAIYESTIKWRTLALFHSFAEYGAE
jgi:hypothetical protein